MQPMRPRFCEVLPSHPDEVVRRLQASEVESDCCQLKILGRHVEVTVEDHLRHTWSPQLSLEVVEHADGTELFGHFGPNPGVWTTFLAAYGFVGCSVFFGGLFGASQQVAGLTPWGLIVLPVGAVAALGIYLASLYGQRLAADQMSELVAFLHASLSIDHTGKFKRELVAGDVAEADA